MGWLFLVSVLKKSGGGSSPRSILHSKAYKHWMYCFLSELAALLDVPTFRLVASSLHFLFLLTWWATQERWRRRVSAAVLQELSYKYQHFTRTPAASKNSRVVAQVVLPSFCPGGAALPG